MTELKEYPVNGTLSQQVEWFLTIDPEILINRERLGDTFVECAELLTKIQDYLSNLEATTIEKLAPQQAERLCKHLREMKTVLDTIIDAHRQPARAGDVAINCQEFFLNYFQKIHSELSHYRPLFMKQPPPVAEVVATVARAKDDLKQIEQISAAQAGEVGVTKKVRHFRNLARAHERKAGKWLCGAIIVGGVLLVVAVWFYLCTPSLVADGFDWDRLVSRFSILGLLIFFEVVLIGNYKAERHNSIVNQHRHNALDTFGTITAATVTQAAKDTIIQTAAGAVYAPQETGFRGGGSAQMKESREILATVTQNNQPE